MARGRTGPLAFSYMQLCHYLTPQAIVVPVKGKTKNEALGQLVSALSELHHLRQPKKLLHAILEREKAGSTFLPIGVAMPHARIHGIDDIKMVMGISPDGIEINQPHSGGEGGRAPSSDGAPGRMTGRAPVTDEIVDGTSYKIHILCLFVSPLTEKEFGRHLKLLACIAALFREEGLVHDLAKCATPDAAFELLQRCERVSTEAKESRPADE